MDVVFPYQVSSSGCLISRWYCLKFLLLFNLTTKVSFLGGGLDSDLIWGGSTDLIERTDYGLVGGLGIDLGQVDLGLQYRFGSANLLPSS